MSESEQRFSYLVEEYFNNRGTYPIVLVRRTSADEAELEQFRDDVHSTFEALTGVAVLDARVVEGDFWSGVLIELSSDTYIEMDNGTPAGEARCYGPARDLHNEFATTRREETIGFSIGTSAYSSSSLEGLGRRFFTTD